MIFDNIIFELTLIFAGASILATVFLYLKQPIILAYITLGVIVGPWGFGFLKEASHIERISHLGIILLMFLLGLNLHPQKLYKLFKETSLITIGTSSIFTVVVMIIAKLFGFSWTDSLISGLALMFSSTVIGLKLIPTVALHHKHIGEMMISVLLFQDILAIMLILFLYGSGKSSIAFVVFLLLLKTILLFIAALIIVKFILLRLFKKFDIIQEYIFLISLGWCLLGAEVAHLLGLSYEIGAFIAGISLGSSAVSLAISEGLKPLREFFLILFFFSIGAKFDFLLTKEVLLPGFIIAIILFVIKPIIFNGAFLLVKEDKNISKELGVRLGQSSEFSLLVAYGALAAGKIEAHTSYLIQLTAILTFIFSTYFVMLKYPTPITLKKKSQKKSSI